MLAVGDVTGRIVFWHGIRKALDAAVGAEAEPVLPQATVHWHAEPVCCLQFSTDGTYMLSGGAGRDVFVGWADSALRAATIRQLPQAAIHIDHQCSVIINHAATFAAPQLRASTQLRATYVASRRPRGCAGGVGCLQRPPNVPTPSG